MFENVKMNGCQALRKLELEKNLQWIENYCIEHGYPSRGSNYNLMAEDEYNLFWDDFDYIAELTN